MEELEDRLLALGEHRAKAAAERIEADNEEEERPASAAVSAAMGVIGRGGAMAGQRRRQTHADMQYQQRLSGAQSLAPVLQPMFTRSH